MHSTIIIIEIQGYKDILFKFSDNGKHIIKIYILNDQSRGIVLMR